MKKWRGYIKYTMGIAKWVKYISCLISLLEYVSHDQTKQYVLHPFFICSLTGSGLGHTLMGESIISLVTAALWGISGSLLVVTKKANCKHRQHLSDSWFITRPEQTWDWDWVCFLFRISSLSHPTQRERERETHPRTHVVCFGATP